MIETIIFWVLAVGAVLGALVVVVPPYGHRPVRSTAGFIGFLFCVAGLYVLLSAHYVAALQVMAYAGTVLFLLSLTLIVLDLTDDELGEGRYTIAKVVGVFAIGVVFTKSLRVLAESTPVTVMADLSLLGQQGYGSAATVVPLVLNDFLLPFELISILLLVAIIGAVAIVRLRDQTTI